MCKVLCSSNEHNKLRHKSQGVCRGPSIDYELFIYDLLNYVDSKLKWFFEVRLECIPYIVNV